MGITTNDLRPIDHMASVNCPVLVAAGDLDRRTTLDETKRLFAAAIEPKELVIFSGAAHVDLLGYAPKQYTSAVLSFLHQHLFSSPIEHAQVQSTMQQDAQPEPVLHGEFAPLKNSFRILQSGATQRLPRAAQTLAELAFAGVPSLLGRLG